MSQQLVTTNDRSFQYPLLPRIKIKSRDGKTTYFTYDSFSANPEIVMPYADMDYGMGESGTFNMIVEDTQNVIDQSKLHFCKVFLELGKTQASLQHFLIGYADIFNIRRQRGPYQEYLLTGLGSGFQASNLYIHMRKAADVNNISDPTVVPNVKYNINNLIKDSFESRKWRPLKDVSIEDITGWEKTGISDNVNTNYPVINSPMTFFSDWLTTICDVTGAVWFLDFSTGKEVLYVDYNPGLHTGITIKTGDQKTNYDDINTTGYVLKSFECTDDGTTGAGVATRLYSISIQDSAMIVQQPITVGKTSLNQQALGQQFVINNDERRMDKFIFTFSKVGNPESPKDRVNGFIILDDGSNRPKGTVLDEFSISLSDIEVTPKAIPVTDLDVRIRFLEGGTNKVWFVFTQRAGLKGQPDNDPANTVFLHHDNIYVTGTNTRPLYSGYTNTAFGDKDKLSTFVWNTTNKGPNYAFGVYSDIRRLFARTSETNVRLIGLKEAFLNPGPLTDPATINKYASLSLIQTSKARRSLPCRVRVPNNFLFRPYQWVTFTDGRNIQQELQVARARYTISALSGVQEVGATYADLTLSGNYHPLVLNTSCDSI